MQNWVLWREKELKKPYKTQRGIEAAYKRLVKLSGGDINIATDIISRSIDREWRDLYALPSQAFGAAEKDLFNEISAAEGAAKRQDEQAAREAALQKLREGQK
jgi:hypothetical protein